MPTIKYKSIVYIQIIWWCNPHYLEQSKCLITTKGTNLKQKISCARWWPTTNFLTKIGSRRGWASSTPSGLQNYALGKEGGQHFVCGTHNWDGGYKTCAPWDGMDMSNEVDRLVSKMSLATKMLMSRLLLKEYDEVLKQLLPW